jgi:hypothetical protein
MPESITTMGIPAAARRPKLSMHAGQCTICRHPFRREIERDFLQWKGPRAIAREYQISSHTVIYRHAHALGLFARRQRALEAVLRLSLCIQELDGTLPLEGAIIWALRHLAKTKSRGSIGGETGGIESRDWPEGSAPQSETKGRRSQSAQIRRP